MEEETKKEETTEAQKEEQQKPLEKMTAPELREIAKDLPGVTGVHAMKKNQLLGIIKEARGIKDEGPAKKAKTKTVKKALSVKELKTKTLQLKEGKEAARKDKDRKKLDRFRRRINRMKKQARKVARG
ncbi:MAG: Rho termination factor N-terminal domain-containing protein [Pseudomonadota bacterium]